MTPAALYERIMSANDDDRFEILGPGSRTICDFRALKALLMPTPDWYIMGDGDGANYPIIESAQEIHCCRHAPEGWPVSCPICEAEAQHRIHSVVTDVGHETGTVTFDIPAPFRIAENPGMAVRENGVTVETVKKLYDERRQRETADGFDDVRAKAADDYVVYQNLAPGQLGFSTAQIHEMIEKTLTVEPGTYRNCSFCGGRHKFTGTGFGNMVECPAVPPNTIISINGREWRRIEL